MKKKAHTSINISGTINLPPGFEAGDSQWYRLVDDSVLLVIRLLPKCPPKKKGKKK